MIRCARTNCYRGGNGQNHEPDDLEGDIEEVTAAVSECRSEAQAQELLGYHRKSAVRALGAPEVEPAPWINVGRPLSYFEGVLSQGQPVQPG